MLAAWCVWLYCASHAGISTAQQVAGAGDNHATGDDAVQAARATFFREHIEPVLRSKCYECHSALSSELGGSLRLDAREPLRRGGDSGAAVAPGKPAESLLLDALRHEQGRAMPPDQPRLPDAVLADFEHWIADGAVDPRQVDPAEERADESRRHWSFQPVVKPMPPDVEDASWASTEIDRFVLAALESRGWRPAPEASRRDWLRRVTFDLTGLPPTPEEVLDFESDTSPLAAERVVDRLLTSPRYGERWAQHWLDVVRYAETEGYEYDRHLPDAWRFRDYVVESLNADKPFDRFVLEQLAGDEIGPADPVCQTAAIFHRLGPVRRNAGNPEIALSRNEVLTERTDIVGAAFLALTVGCARCHDHKLEPLTQQDYYRLEAYFAATAEHDIVLASAEERRAWEQGKQELEQQIQRVKERARAAEGIEKERLELEVDALEDRLPQPLPTIPSTRNDFAARTPIHVLRRGEWERKAELVGPSPPQILRGGERDVLDAEVSDPRTRLAQWLIGPTQPLTARVLVNRVWQHHFGAGLVRTPNDFGLHGERPTHPELLDWLAATLVEEGWRLKPLHRRLVLSAAYRQGTRPAEPRRLAEDPDNRWLSRFSRRRLSAEELRDAMLAVAGRLNDRIAGPSVMPPVDPDLVALLYKPSQWRVHPDACEHDRRTLYLIAKRNLRLPFLETFDAPALLGSCPRRETSTHAPQSLEMLNGDFANSMAESLVERLGRETATPEEWLDRALSLTVSRPATASERSLVFEYLRERPGAAALHELALVVLNLNEFQYVP